MWACCAALLLTACGGSGMGSMSGGTSSSSSGAQTGTALMTLTDAAGDFLSYTVTVTSIQLKTAGGVSVETLPVATTIDFTQLVNLSEVISAGQIPAGSYVSASVTVDYSGATITADDGNGNPVTLAPVDPSGNPLTGPVTQTVTLDKSHPMVINPGRAGLMALDFNLAASNTVDLTAARVTVSPQLVATVVPSSNRPIRVRGTLAGTDTAGNDFVLKVQPFYDASHTAGQVTVDVTPATTYIIDGRAYVGGAGLAALAALSADERVLASGTLLTTSAGASSSSSSSSAPTVTSTILATSVVAGTSLFSAQHDQVAGTVIARSGDTLTLHAATWYPARTSVFHFLTGHAIVTLGPDTVVLAQGRTLTAADVSVGQHIEVFGTAAQTSASSSSSSDSSSSGSSSSSGMSGSSMSGPGPSHPDMGQSLQLDATAGEVQLDPTPVLGVVTSTGQGSVTLNLKSLSGLPVSLFNFAGTGAAGGQDSQPGAYVVSVPAGLSIDGLTAGTPAGFTGTVAPFGMAPPDFAAQTVVGFAGVTNYLSLSWGMGGSTTAVTLGSTSLQVAVAGLGSQHYILQGPVRVDVSGLSTALAIAPGDGDTLFSIGHWGRSATDNFDSFGDFEMQLATDLNGTTPVLGVMASGSYNSSTRTFTATRLLILLGG